MMIEGFWRPKGTWIRWIRNAAWEHARLRQAHQQLPRLGGQLSAVSHGGLTRAPGYTPSRLSLFCQKKKMNE
jgi:hypothetical protein